MRLAIVAVPALLLILAACGDDDDAPADPTPIPTPVDVVFEVGSCDAGPTPMGADDPDLGTIVPGRLLVGFVMGTTREAALQFLDEQGYDYRLSTNAFAAQTAAIICVELGQEDAVTRSLPLGGVLRFVQRDRLGSGL